MRKTHKHTDSYNILLVILSQKKPYFNINLTFFLENVLYYLNTIETTENLYHDAVNELSKWKDEDWKDRYLPLTWDELKQMEGKPVWVELGLQTIHRRTAEAMGIGYDVSCFDRACSDLASRGIKTVAHLILGLPGETHDMMLESVKHVASMPVYGVKLHLMNIVSNSRLYSMMPDYVPFKSIEEYIELVTECLEYIPEDITIHRLTGDVPRRYLVSPEWSYKKRTILNGINRRLRELDIRQGDRCMK